MGFACMTTLDCHPPDGVGGQSEGLVEEVSPFWNKDTTARRGKRRIRQRIRSARLTVLLAALVALVASGITSWITARSLSGVCNSRNDLWSPARDNVEYFDLDINNEFAAESRYRGPPTPELDAAWEELWRFGYVGIPRDKLPELNRQEHFPDGRTVARINRRTDHFQASLEVFH
ncbi:uncharacterized protein Z519_11716 [Cladophialophora bantiana CBS 173.52]|uniref:Uncharacterized protein n=1 Tax=Cladophialophora bantiana (strain ATCC 10958 / CBS 173.52 / CDC B-1940 / NIH 8579) TaxID=1442370 RepID=A0A0D2FLZ1_CLAB1|nr:uncharacterized protein Z519_11716 [Cladophialophora bantiana CBS 173.52]KIW87742.1 hypothetical protein Z519_11716 [Cladophialophora bantiana CBS 173.52]